MADKKSLPKGYSIETKFDPTYGPFATVQVLMQGGQEIATIRNGKVVESNDPKIAVGSSSESAISYVDSKAPQSSSSTSAPKAADNSPQAPTGTATSTSDLEVPLADAKEAAGRALTIANAYPQGSKQYKSALADYKQAQDKLDQIQKQYDFAKQYEVNKASQDKTDAATKAQQTVATAQKELDDAQKRAKDFPNTPGAQQLINDKQQALQQAQSAAAKASSDAAAAQSTAKASGGTTPPASTPPTGGSKPGQTPPAKTPVPTTDPQADLYQGGGATSPAASKPSTGSGSNNPPAKKTVPPVTPPASPADAMKEFEAKYGVEAALVNSDPSLTKLFKDAMDQKMTPAAFKVAFQQSAWAQARSDSAQQAETARLESPQSYAQAYDGMRNYLARLAVTMGENLNPSDLGGAYDPAKGRQGNLVEAALDQQWGSGLDETKMRQLILSKAKLNTTLPGGEAGGYMSQLKGLANDYGMNSLTTNNSQWLNDNAQAILLGTKNINTVKQEVVEMAKNNYKPYAAQLDAGVTLRGIATPYLNTLSNLLEVPTDSIDLSSPTGYGKMVSNALMGTDPSNPTPMTLNAFETQVKQDPRWASTTNARDTVMGGVGGLLKLLGKVS